MVVVFVGRKRKDDFKKRVTIRVYESDLDLMAQHETTVQKEWDYYVKCVHKKLNKENLRK